MLKIKGLMIWLAIFLCSCSSLSGSEEKITWYFQLATPEHYDIWVEHLQFERSGVRRWYHPAGYMSCCWKGPSGPSGVSGFMEPFPNYVAIQWFSFSEQKFYQRLIEIPSEWKERMKELAPSYTPKRMRMTPRDTLTFGLAPGGEIVVWMMGQVGNEVELARFQANELDRDPEIYSVNTRDYLENHGDYLEQHGIPLSGW